MPGWELGISGFQSTIPDADLNPRLDINPDIAKRLPPEDIYEEGGIVDSSIGDISLYKSIISEDLQRSLVTITNNSTDRTLYSVLNKEFSKITIPSTNQYEAYYAFGTSLFMDDKQENPIQAGGIGVFMNSSGSSGYLIKIDTTASSESANSKKDLKILKIQNNSFKPLKDSQTTDLTTLAGVYGGRAYRIDVKIKATELINEIKVYVNGFLVSAKDIKDDDGTNEDPTPVTINQPSKYISMFAQVGKVSFDYVYGLRITKEQFEDQEYNMNVFDGQYSKNLLSFNFGNKVFNQNSEDEIQGSVEEFGPVARELKRFKIRFSKRPAEPLWASTGANDNAEVIGSKFNNFGGEVYVLNNSGMFIPLEDGEDFSFYIPGPSIGKFGEFQYSVDLDNEYTTEDPIVFQSNWIQNQSEAVALENWIRTVWSKKQMTINMNVFGMPILSVGDVISINYPYQELDSSRQFVITNITHSFRGGLETSIVCRSL